MPVWMKAAGKFGSILVLIALAITLLKQLIAFIGFLTIMVKILVIVVFAALIIGVGVMILRGMRDNRRKKE